MFGTRAVFFSLDLFVIDYEPKTLRHKLRHFMAFWGAQMSGLKSGVRVPKFSLFYF